MAVRSFQWLPCSLSPVSNEFVALVKQKLRESALERMKLEKLKVCLNSFRNMPMIEAPSRVVMLLLKMTVPFV
jgi:hypothetical protein